MARIRDIPGRQTRDSYPFSIAIRAMYGDLDANHHINNVALARFVEETTASLNMQVFGEDAIVCPSGGVQLLTASLSIDFVAQGFYPGEVAALGGISHLGRTSFVYACALFQGDSCIAVAETTLVYAREGGSLAVPDDVRAAMQIFMLNN